MNMILSDYQDGKLSQRFELSKPGKKEVETLLDNLEGQLLSNVVDGYKLGVTLAKLQRYFAANDTAKSIASDPVKWCLQAVSKDEIRKAICAAKIVDGNLVATDGRRLHLLKGYTEHTDGALLPSGAHISEAEYAKEFGTFPNYKQVMPCNAIAQPGIRFEVRQGYKAELTYTLPASAFPAEKAGVNEKFLKQATAGMDNPSYASADIMSPIVVESGNRYAVIMPIRIK